MATTYLKRLPVSDGSDTTGTLSAWVKRGAVGVQTAVLCGQEGTNDNQRIFFGWWVDDTLALQIRNAGTNYEQSSVAKYRDPGAWYHLVARLDTSNGVAQDRIQLFVNGEKMTTYTNNSTFPSSVKIKLFENTTACETLVGVRKNGVGYESILSGSMSHVHVIDGTAYDASTFGETDATSGIWKIKTSPTVTYGTNGFNLKMEDRTNLDLDSGTNNFTDFVTAGTPTATYDNPSNNFCTMNPINNYYAGMTLSNGNTTLVTGSGIYAPLQATLGMAGGKWYWEMKCIASPTNNEYLPGIASTQTTSSGAYLGDTANDYSMRSANGQYYTNASGTAYGSSYDDGDIISIALDLTNSKLYFAINGTWQDSGDPTSGATGTGAISITAVGSTAFGAYVPAFTYWDSGTGTVNYNFGNGYFGTTAVASTNADDAGIGSFEYDVPAGFYALCTKNIKAYGG